MSELFLSHYHDLSLVQTRIYKVLVFRFCYSHSFLNLYFTYWLYNWLHVGDDILSHIKKSPCPLLELGGMRTWVAISHCPAPTRRT